MKVFLFQIVASFFLLASRANASILPENDLYLEDKFELDGGITEDQFNSITDSVLDFYQPFAASHGAQLVPFKLWSDSKVNAGARQETPEEWQIYMYGGLARRPEITPDGFALVVCHELGHHFGGYPFASAWAADEGQADYFASQHCARKIWATEKTENLKFRETVGKFEKSKCDKAWKKQADKDVCYRISLAAQSLANLLAAKRNKSLAKFDTPDTTVVDATSHDHPAAQCRLDTYFNASLCKLSFDPTFIPGKLDGVGANTPESESIALRYSCATPTTKRPSCWFKSLLLEPKTL